ncbi:MAG: DUF4250 domain-containing protein [Butyrivibrio sp.]|nr:DUF4250 domain-containing protein [Butyrivibrio sp.]
MIPQDPVILLSYINTQLRDNYNDLNALADGLDISMDELKNITQKLEAIGYKYDNSSNRFV